MDVTWKNAVWALGLLALLFLGIPIQVKVSDPVEKEFLQFIQKHNKTYADNPVEYERRLEYFKVALLSLNC